MTRLRIGVDLGGTKIEAVALTDDGREASRHRVGTPRTYEGTLDAVADLVAQTEKDGNGTGPVGIGIPGVVSPATGFVKNANSTWLIGKPLDRDLADRLDRPVRLMNDANCFALSEASDGAAAGADVVFGVILGTGVGGGITIHGRPLQGQQLIAGEWGHNPLPWPRDAERPGPPCYCGKSGCVETFVSGPGMEHDHEAVAGSRLTTREIFIADERGDRDARATVERYVERLGRALAVVVNILDPNVVVFGGGMSNMPGLAAAASEAMRPWVFSDTVTTRVVKNQHGDSSGVRGAAWLWRVGEAG
ncbi:MAG: ROK family protein [Gemmatimonadetes bacterium]|nr:ROK family protein [Gemmatimonadota bacterium]